MKKIILPAFILLLSSFILTACLKTDVQSTATPTDYIKVSSSDDCEFIEATAEPFTSPVSLSNGCWTRSLNDSEAEEYHH